MPIGKNSIKRVVNSGYSKVKTDCPDMENSTVLTNPTPEVTETLAPSATPSKKSPARKPASKGTVQKTPVKKSASAKALPKSAAAEKGTAFLRVEVGEELPVYLL